MTSTLPFIPLSWIIRAEQVIIEAQHRTLERLRAERRAARFARPHLEPKSLFFVRGSCGTTYDVFDNAGAAYGFAHALPASAYARVYERIGTELRLCK